MEDILNNMISATVKSSSVFKERIGIKDKIKQFRQELIKTFPFIHRLAVVLYIEDQDILQTYAYDEDIDSNFHHYDAKYCACTSLRELAEKSSYRIENDISDVYYKGSEHSKQILKSNYMASFTMPLIIEGYLLGFLFANSRTKDVMYGDVIERLKLMSMVVALWMYQDQSRFDVLKSTVESLRILSQHRDPETGEHLLRMSSYARLIAHEVSDDYGLSDVEIAHLYLYSTLHDIGKLGVPDSILLKPGTLTNEEFEIMKTHTHKGADIAAKLIELYKLSDIPNVSMLFNIIRSHHEKLDGTGYPDGLSGMQISIEARIITVADIFDALTSVRPYKKAWSNEEAFQELQRLSGTKLDALCVNALCCNKDKIKSIQQMYADKTHADNIVNMGKPIDMAIKANSR